MTARPSINKDIKKSENNERHTVYSLITNLQILHTGLPEKPWAPFEALIKTKTKIKKILINL